MPAGLVCLDPVPQRRWWCGIPFILTPPPFYFTRLWCPLNPSYLNASVAFTMDVYSHIIEGMQEDAMALLDGVLLAGKNGTKNKINANLTPTLENLVPKHGDLASMPA